jgi:phage shock protein E
VEDENLSARPAIINKFFIEIRMAKYSLNILLCVIFVLVIWYIYISTTSYEISPNLARDNLKRGHYDYVVDVRTTQEWDEGHLSYVINIPIGNLVNELPQKIPDRNASILFICKKGIRASGVVTIAHKLGYRNVQAMIGNYKELENN